MKRIICLILALGMMFTASCVSAAGNTSNEEKIVASYNSIAKKMGAELLDIGKMQHGVETLDFPCKNCVVIITPNVKGKITRITVDLLAGGNEGDFITTCMTVISLLGGNDYKSFGQMVYEFSQVKATGKTGEIIMMGKDWFCMFHATGEYKMAFAYFNDDLK